MTYEYDASYDSRGHVLTSTDAMGNTTTYNYDDTGLLTSTTDAAGSSGSSYNTNGTVATTTDADGHVTTYTYDAGGNGELLQINPPGGGGTSMTYDANHRVSTTTDAAGRTTTYQYDALGNVTETSSVGNDQLTHISTTTYDAQNRVIHTVDPQGHVTDTIYGPNGKVATTTDHTLDANGNWVPQPPTVYEYDAAGELLRTIYPDGTQADSVYDADGRVILGTDRYVPGQSDPINGSRTVYDGAGRAIDSQRVMGVSVSIASNPDGTYRITAISGGGIVTANGKATLDPNFTGWLSDSRTIYNDDGTVKQSIQLYQTTAGGVDVSQPDSLTTYGYDADGRTTMTAVNE